MVRKVIFFTGIIIFSLFHSGYGEELYTIENINFIPPRYYIGDEVELKIKISMPEDTEIIVPVTPKVTEWIEITSVKILPFRIMNGRKVHDVSIFFISFKTGTLTLPRLLIGDIELTNLEIHTSSVFEDNKEAGFAPSKGQLNLPDTFVKIFLSLLIIILLPIFLFIISKFVIKRLIKSGKIMYLQDPYAILRKNLKKLKKQMKDMDFRSFYIKLSDFFKKYLQVRLSIPALTSTTREISMLARHNVLEQELSNEILKILTLSDFVKFGDRPSNENEMDETIRKVYFIVRCIEEEKKSVEP